MPLVTSWFLVFGLDLVEERLDMSRLLATCLNFKKPTNYFVDEKLKTELALVRIKGPYAYPLLPNFKFSPLGVGPKKDHNSFRLIHDLSFGPVTLETFDDDALMVIPAGKGCLLSKGYIVTIFKTHFL